MSKNAPLKYKFFGLSRGGEEIPPDHYEVEQKADGFVVRFNDKYRPARPSYVRWAPFFHSATGIK